MKPKSKKQKGKKFENQVANILHEYLYNNSLEYRDLYEKTNEKISRDFASGNFDNSTGDINLSIAKKIFPFYIECKHWKDFNDYNIHNILNGKINKLLNVYNETKEKSKQFYKKYKLELKPFVIFKGNRTDIFVLFDTKNNIEIYRECITQNLSFVHIYGMIIMKLDDFLKGNIWQWLKNT